MLKVKCLKYLSDNRKTISFQGITVTIDFEKVNVILILIGRKIGMIAD